jgi:hypothetical protein
VALGFEEFQERGTDFGGFHPGAFVSMRADVDRPASRIGA